jgi:hypothetical protein
MTSGEPTSASLAAPGRALLLLAMAGMILWAVCESPSMGQTSDGLRSTEVIAGGRAGLRRYWPHTWGIVSVDAINRTDRPAEIPAVFYFTSDPTTQFVRRFWVPPHSMRHSWCPVRLPEVPDGREVVELVTLTLDASGSSEVLARNSSGELRPTHLLPVSLNPESTSMVGDRVDSKPAVSKLTADAVVAMREAAGLIPDIGFFFEDFFPPTTESLEGLSHLVVSGNHLASDTAAMTVVRRWLHGGGRLWIMLDQVDPRTVELLLGNAFDCHVVDRVGLSSVRIEGGPFDSAPSEQSAREFEEPVDLVRVVTSNEKVMQTVNGWPASFWQPAGEGMVLFTTLGPRGWMRMRSRYDPHPKSPLGSLNYIAIEPLQFLANKFLAGGKAPPFEPASFEPYLAEQIGYRIVDRQSVAAVLGGFCLVLAASGIWLRRSGRPQRLLWIAPAAALVAGAILVLAGELLQRSVPPTVALVQWVRAEPDVEDVHVKGLMSIYNQGPNAGPLGTRRGGMFLPDMTGLKGVTRRMVWTDIGVWHWENLTLPGGVRSAPFHFGTKIDGLIGARSRLGPDGLRGSLASGPFANPSDAILAMPSGDRLAIAIGADGTFTAGSVLAPDQFIDAQLLDSRQHRRQSVYQRLLGGKNPLMAVDRPLLIAWADPLDMQFRVSPQAKQVGSALLSVPLEIEQAPPGTKVSIPSPLVSFRCVPGPGKQISTAYFNARQEWLACRTASRVWLRFQIPKQVLPLTPSRATLEVKIAAPDWTVQVVGLAGETQIPLESWNGPVGNHLCKIDQPEVLLLDGEGGLLLGIHVGDKAAGPAADPREGKARPAWKIDSVQLEVAGETLPPDK